eukprot:4704652-Pleurochrysis_carterae.AAC.1
MYPLARIPVHNSSEGPMFLHAGTQFGSSAMLRPELGVAGYAKFSVATGTKARLHAIKAAR